MNYGKDTVHQDHDHDNEMDIVEGDDIDADLNE